jgi:hypothetical protein
LLNLLNAHDLAIGTAIWLEAAQRSPMKHNISYKTLGIVMGASACDSRHEVILSKPRADCASYVLSRRPLAMVVVAGDHVGGRSISEKLGGFRLTFPREHGIKKTHLKISD